LITIPVAKSSRVNILFKILEISSMKKLLLGGLLLMLLLSSCGTTVWQMKTKCDVPTKEMFKKISIVFMQENFLIKENDAEMGYLLAETTPEHDPWFGGTNVRIWMFQAQGDIITAQARSARTTSNVYGATTGGSVTYINDEFSEDLTWYWNVRNKLEDICGNKIQFIKSKTR
jgi:hypothetical protein